MSHYNHFAECQYQSIKFTQVKIGDKFRRAKFTGSRLSYIICIKTSDSTYMDKASKKEHRLFAAEAYEVYTLEKNTLTPNASK